MPQHQAATAIIWNPTRKKERMICIVCMHTYINVYGHVYVSNWVIEEVDFELRGKEVKVRQAIFKRTSEHSKFLLAFDLFRRGCIIGLVF